MQKIKRLLLVEDDRTLGGLYMYLLQAEGYTVEWVMNCLLAKVKLSQTRYDLILLDVMLPDLSGIEFLSEPLLPISKTLVLTNLDHERAHQQIRAYGIDKILIKSDQTPETFLASVKNCLTT
ncbi:response regulator [Patescibacteria group bacterium]|nr:response regulator [Patescibacteria group bacterium]